MLLSKSARLRSNGDMKIRPATAQDLPAVLAIYNEAVRHTTAIYEEEEQTLEQRARWLADHERNGYAVFVAVAETGKSPVMGWGALSEFRPQKGYRSTVEVSVYVAAAWRRQGVGRQLLVQLTGAARARGGHALMGVVDSGNTGSFRLLERAGFQKVAHLPEVGYKFGQWLDVVYLQLLL